jgi:hypothetical protein
MKEFENRSNRTVGKRTRLNSGEVSFPKLLTEINFLTETIQRNATNEKEMMKT